MTAWWCAIAWAAVPDSSAQVLLVLVDTQEASEATLYRAVRQGRDPWQLVGAPVPARVGLSGVAWGLGLHEPQPGVQKVEGDLKTPAGVFVLGSAYRDDSVPPLTVAWPLATVGERDLWVEDPLSPHYNAHIVVPGDRPLLPWERRARMALSDPYLALKVFVAHNAVGPGRPAVAGAGSAIFLHSGAPAGDVATAGCVAIDRSALTSVLGWLDPGAHPVMVVLTRAQHQERVVSWRLPRPAPQSLPESPRR